MKTLEEIKNDFEEKFYNLVGDLLMESYSQTYYGDEGYGERPDKFVFKKLWNFIESTISQTKQELIEEIKKESEKLFRQLSGDLTLVNGNFQNRDLVSDKKYFDEFLDNLENHK